MLFLQEFKIFSKHYVLQCIFILYKKRKESSSAGASFSRLGIRANRIASKSDRDESVIRKGMDKVRGVGVDSLQCVCLSVRGPFLLRTLIKSSVSTSRAGEFPSSGLFFFDPPGHLFETDAFSPLSLLPPCPSLCVCVCVFLFLSLSLSFMLSSFLYRSLTHSRSFLSFSFSIIHYAIIDLHWRRRQCAS